MSDPNAAASAGSQTEIAAAIEEIKQQQAELREQLEANSELTVKTNAMTEEMFEIFSAAKGGIKVMTWLGAGVKWASGIAAAVVALWLFMRGGGPPTR